MDQVIYNSIPCLGAECFLTLKEKVARQEESSDFPYRATDWRDLVVSHDEFHELHDPGVRVPRTFAHDRKGLVAAEDDAACQRQ